MAGAVAAGATLRSHVTVQELELRPGGGAVMRFTGREVLEAERLLIAAGPWTAPLARQIGGELALGVARHVVATTRLADAARIAFGHSDLVTGYYCRPAAAGRAVLGGP